jgi:hypothetical protein
MDLTQRKLTKAEWNSIEVPVSVQEKRIGDLIQSGYEDVNIRRNYTTSLLKYMKIAYSSVNDTYIYAKYLQTDLLLLAKKYELVLDAIDVSSIKMKKADIIRFSNTDKQLADQKNNIYEFIILDFLCKLYELKNPKATKSKKGEKQGEVKQKQKQVSSDQWIFYYYTIKTLFTYNIELANQSFIKIIGGWLKQLDSEINPSALVLMGYQLIEMNENLLKYADESLYDHQKKLFTLCKQTAKPKLILYIAPTGTGKTLSPLGLAHSNKVIFVCAARHVGLALAKAAVSAGKRIAFAFGCSDAADIRLHYSAAKEFTRNKKTGAIDKVDNSIGDKVEIMISDIKSYLPAMYYMLAFNPKEKIILYWDEPTITMDYPVHEFHAIIKENWTKNTIPNVVLSSATLPHIDEIQEVIMDFKATFDNADIHEIVSHDSKKTIPLINKEGYVEMPHYLYGEDDYEKICEVVLHCKRNKTLLRYIDLSEAIKFIKYVNDINKSAGSDIYLKSPRYALENNFPSFESVNMSAIKEYYLDLLGNLKKEQWPVICKALRSMRICKMVSNINIVTTDAHTLTAGPTIFLAADIENIATFYIQNAQIPEAVIKDIMGKIEANSLINAKIRVMEKDLEDGTKKDESKEKKMSEGRVDPEMKKLMMKIEQTRMQVKSVTLNPKYVPNTKEHLQKYASAAGASAAGASAAGASAAGASAAGASATGASATGASGAAAQAENKKPQFTCDISEYMVEQIMLVDDVSDMWKLLLLMGIGVFAIHKSDRYTEIMKTLAQEQKLFVIIASTDYIYGTNYQFCHGYISKDLDDMSQEKCIQAMGRVGRNKLQQDYTIRFRDNDLILKLFMKEENKPEVQNMNVLFTSD